MTKFVFSLLLHSLAFLLVSSLLLWAHISSPMNFWKGETFRLKHDELLRDSAGRLPLLLPNLTSLRGKDEPRFTFVVITRERSVNYILL